MKPKVKVNSKESESIEYKTYTTGFIILPKQSNIYGQCWVYLEVAVTNKIKEGYILKSEKRIRRRFNTGVLVEPKNWSKTNERTKSVELNNKLLKFKLDLENKIQGIKEGKIFTKIDDDIKVLHSLFAVTKAKEKIKQKTFLEYLDEYIIYRKGIGSPYGTVKQYTSLKNRLKKYQDDNEEEITFASINLTLSDKLIKHFSGKEYHPNTIKKTIDFFKTVLNYFYDRKEELHIELSDKFKHKEFGDIKEIKTDPIALNEIEIQIIQNFDFNAAKEKELDQLTKDLKNGKVEGTKKEFYTTNIINKYNGVEKTRKRVLLQLSTGLRVSDLFNITPSSINGELIILRPKKTINTKSDNTIYIPLNSISKTILKELNFDSAKLKISSQKYNEGIKQMLQIIGFNEDVEVYEFKGMNNAKSNKIKKYDVITSHNLRDTFISMAIKKNVPIPILLKATGQSSFEVMKRYIKLENQDMVNHLGKLF